MSDDTNGGEVTFSGPYGEKDPVKERLAKIEKALDDLCSALQRRGTEQDGNWGWPAFHEELTQIRLALAVPAEKG